jgi:rare lipoprotein A
MNHQLWKSFTVAVLVSGLGSYSCAANAHEDDFKSEARQLGSASTSTEVARMAELAVDTAQAEPVRDYELLLINWDASPEVTSGAIEEAAAEFSESEAVETEAIRQAYVLPDTLPKPEFPEEVVVYREEGWASWYGPGFEGNLTANGEIFNSQLVSAAHPSLPFGTQVRVTNLDNGRTLTVRINDRGPYIGGRIIDLSAEAAAQLGMLQSGVAPVSVEIMASPVEVGK